MTLNTSTYTCKLFSSSQIGCLQQSISQGLYYNIHNKYGKLGSNISFFSYPTSSVRLTSLSNQMVRSNTTSALFECWHLEILSTLSVEPLDEMHCKSSCTSDFRSFKAIGQVTQTQWS